tara:strand:+ start:560 stop:997 length:438 start_codon:yes stop_codon:yes gene_type:complete
MDTIEYLHIYFDGSLHSFSTLLWAKDQLFRIWITMPENIDQELKDFAHSFRDCVGTLSHYDHENKRRVWHVSYGYPTKCIHRLDTEFYFEKLADLSEDSQEKIASLTRICYNKVNGEPCLKCPDCLRATSHAEMYGLYDFVQQTA